MNNRSLIFPLMLLFTACDVSEAPKGKIITIQNGEQINRYHDPVQVAEGGELFQKHCAQCHGNNGEGDPEWRQRDADGMFPPPPLNGSGHAWHHPITFLRERIKNGTVPEGRMPAQGDKLSSDEIDAVIAWFQSQWPDQLYGAWHEIEQRNK